MTKDEIFKQQQMEMSNEELIDLCDKAISKMCKTGGRSFIMTVPCRVDDTDMILSELVRRFKEMTDWILVENKLPERNKNVLLKRDKPFHLYHLTGFQRDGIFYSNQDAALLGKVIAWMPLPE